MKLLFIFSLLVPIKASAFKILYNVNGEQRLEEFGPGGRTWAEEVWNESKDGPLPASAPIGHAERVIQAGKPTLRSNQSLKDAEDARAADQAKKDAAEAAALSSLKSAAQKIKNGTASDADVSLVLQMLINKQGL